MEAATAPATMEVAAATQVQSLSVPAVLSGATTHTATVITITTAAVTTILT